MDTNCEKYPITFPEGIIGLEQYRNFVLQGIPEQEHFKILQSSDDDLFGLVITSPFWFMPDYVFDVPDVYISQIGDVKNLEVFVVVALATNPQDITVNLLGPIIVNMQAGIGYQVLASETKYSTRHKLCAGDGR